MMAGRGRFDERCPHCGTKIAVHEHFVSHDYSNCFTMECPLCEEEIEVEVHSVPEFELRKVDDPAVPRY
jgi:transcription elongation factor Elf1